MERTRITKITPFNGHKWALLKIKIHTATGPKQITYKTPVLSNKSLKPVCLESFAPTPRSGLMASLQWHSESCRHPDVGEIGDECVKSRQNSMFAKYTAWYNQILAICTAKNAIWEEAMHAFFNPWKFMRRFMLLGKTMIHSVFMLFEVILYR